MERLTTNLEYSRLVGASEVLVTVFWVRETSLFKALQLVVCGDLQDIGDILIIESNNN